MAAISLFQDPAFSVLNLAAAISEQPYVPGRIGAMGLFTEEGIPTTTVLIDYDGSALKLVAAKPRGGVAQVVNAGRRKQIPFITTHLPERSTIYADEVQNIRAFGQQTELEVALDRVAKLQGKHRLQLDMTHEWQRVGAIRGQIIDADGTTVLLDLYEAFGIEQQVVAMGLDVPATELRLKAGEVVDRIEDVLGGSPFSKVRAICGKNFWNALIVHKAIKETYLNTTQAAELRGDTRGEFEFGGIVWERYRGKVGTQAYVPDDEAFAFPEGVPELFITRFAPGDYMETVNTIGLPYYTKTEPLRFDKGVEIESQSNPLHINTRPAAVVRMVRGSVVP